MLHGCLKGNGTSTGQSVRWHLFALTAVWLCLDLRFELEAQHELFSQEEPGEQMQRHQKLTTVLLADLIGVMCCFAGDG